MHGRPKVKRTRGQLRAELLAEAGEVVSELLDWHADAAAPVLTKIEDVVLMLRKLLGERIAGVVKAVTWACLFAGLVFLCARLLNAGSNGEANGYASSYSYGDVVQGYTGADADYQSDYHAENHVLGQSFFPFYVSCGVGLHLTVM